MYIILGLVIGVIIYLLGKYLYSKITIQKEEYWEDFSKATLGKKLKKPK